MASACVAMPFGGQFYVGPQPKPMTEPQTGYKFCQGITLDVPSSLLTGSPTPEAPPPTHFPFSPSMHDATGPLWKNTRTTGRRNLGKTREQGKRAREQASDIENEVAEPVTKKARPAPPTETTNPSANGYAPPPAPQRPYQGVTLATLRPLPKHLASFLRASAVAIGNRRAAAKHRSGGAPAAATKRPAMPRTPAAPSPTPARPGKAFNTGRPVKTSPISQGAVAKDALDQGKPVPATSPADPCPPPVTPKQAFKKRRAASPTTTFQDSPAKENSGQSNPSPVTSSTSPSPASATSERVFRISRRTSPRSPFEDYVAQEGEPDLAAPDADSAMAMLNEGLSATGSSCTDDSTNSPVTAPAVSAALEGQQESSEAMETDGHGIACYRCSTMGSLAPSLPASGYSCPHTATSAVSAPAVSAASQGLLERPEAMRTSGSGTASRLGSTVGILVQGLPSWAFACQDTATSSASAAAACAAL